AEGQAQVRVNELLRVALFGLAVDEQRRKPMPFVVWVSKSVLNQKGGTVFLPMSSDWTSPWALSSSRSTIRASDQAPVSSSSGSTCPGTGEGPSENPRTVAGFRLDRVGTRPPPPALATLG